MTFTITVYGTDRDELTDYDRERLAFHVHDYLAEELGLTPETVSVEGYMEDV